ncbi:hypothetical protein BaRGS_00006485, partial [Batillaria attramentaria]
MSENSGKTILVTGGTGYVGSHTVLELLQAGFKVVVIDNCSNSSMESIRRVEQLSGKKVDAYQVDLVDKAAVQDVFSKHQVYCVIHMASLKAVGESCKRPFTYYKTNLFGCLNLIEVMSDNNVFNLIFSSSATVYGPPKVLPLVETLETGGCTNPYGRTKFFQEQILKDICQADKRWNIILLRYFNPVGAHESGLIGEDPVGEPYNIMPYIAQVAVGRLQELKVFGNDFDTPDGTGVRDYIHVMDLAKGHLAAIKKIDQRSDTQPNIYNLGTGKGISVLEIVAAFEKSIGKKVPHKIVGRREGDVDAMIADPSKANKELGWKAERGLQEMCDTLWKFQSKNPYGYKDSQADGFNKRRTLGDSNKRRRADGFNKRKTFGDSNKRRTLGDSNKRRRADGFNKRRTLGDSNKRRRADGFNKRKTFGDSKKRRTLGDSSKRRRASDFKKRNTPGDSNKRRTLGDSNKRRRADGFNKCNTFGDSKKRRTLGDSNKRRRASDFKKCNTLGDSKKRRRASDFKKCNTLGDSNKRRTLGDSNKRRRAGDFNKRKTFGDSNKRRRASDFKKRNTLGNSNKRRKAGDFNERKTFGDSNKRPYTWQFAAPGCVWST